MSVADTNVLVHSSNIASPEHARARSFAQRFTVLEDSPLVWQELMALSRRFTFGGKQVHDANIVATMLAYGESRLLNFNTADFRRFDALIELVAP